MLRRIPWIRLLTAGFFLWWTFSFAREAVAEEKNYAGAFGAAICLTVSGFLIGTALVRPAARPFMGLIDRVYFGNSTGDEVPLLNLRLARAYRSERCFQKAVEECERQLEFHSLSPDLWAELLLAYRYAGNRVAEAETLDRAITCLGMTRTPARFAKIVMDRDNLPPIAEGLMSQFER